jgi:hypothetical protein
MRIFPWSNSVGSATLHFLRLSAWRSSAPVAQSSSCSLPVYDVLGRNCADLRELSPLIAPMVVISTKYINWLRGPQCEMMKTKNWNQPFLVEITECLSFPLPVFYFLFYNILKSRRTVVNSVHFFNLWGGVRLGPLVCPLHQAGMEDE